MAKAESKGFFRRIGAFLRGLRQFLANLMFLLIITVVLVAIFAKHPQVPARAALVLNPKGVVVEQLGPFDPLAELNGNGKRESRLANLLEAVDRAGKDSRIEMLVLSLDGLDHIGVAKSLELAQAIARFRETGKAVVAIGSSYDQDQYFLAAQADEVYLDPMGAVTLEGFGIYRHYYRRALDKLSVQFHVFRVGDYKSALEPLIRDDMSAEAREANSAWLEQLWGLYTRTVAERRGIREENLDYYINKIDKVLAAHDGDSAAAALSARLVDDLLSRTALRELLIERVGENDDGSFNQIDYREYLSLTRKRQPETRRSVGVLVASGVIADGAQPPGMIGGDSLAKLIRQARKDDDIESVVLRVDSGGGSAFASEVIRQELLKLKKAGKPLVVSMGSAAASGGYWIAADADEIWATPATLTGSIGIFGAFPSVEQALKELGISTDGVGTTEVAGGLRIDRPLSPVAARAIQSGIEHGYQRFLGIVAAGRDMLVEQVEPIARGRVWTGQDAVQLGLVDKLGTLEQAVESAAALAGLDEYRVEWVKPPLTPMEEVLKLMLQADGESAQSPMASSSLSAARRWLSPLLGSVEELLQLNDPRGVYAYCSVCLAP